MLQRIVWEVLRTFQALDTVGPFQSSVSNYETTRCIPEESHPHTHRRQNFNFHVFPLVLYKMRFEK